METLALHRRGEAAVIGHKQRRRPASLEFETGLNHARILHQRCAHDLEACPAVDVMLWLLARPAISGLLNIGSGRARSWLDLAKAMFVAANKDPAIEFTDMPAEISSGYQNFTQADIGKLRSLGYDRPMTSLEDGIHDYVSNYLAKDDPYL